MKGKRNFKQLEDFNTEHDEEARRYELGNAFVVRRADVHLSCSHARVRANVVAINRMARETGLPFVVLRELGAAICRMAREWLESFPVWRANWGINLSYCAGTTKSTWTAWAATDAARGGLGVAPGARRPCAPLRRLSPATAVRSHGTRVEFHCSLV